MTLQPTAHTPLAAIDIGTNTVRLLIARPVWQGELLTLQVLHDAAATLRLGQGVEETGRLDSARIERAVAALAAYRSQAEQAGATTILLAATSAVRDASNGAAFRQQVAERCGLTMEIIAGEREAALTFAGATLGYDLRGTILVADLGGGSLELIASHDGVVQSAQSVQLGSGRLTERHLRAAGPTQEALAAVAIDARTVLEPIIAPWPRLDRLIVGGGTAMSIPVLLAQPASATTLTLAMLDTALVRLRQQGTEEIAGQTGLDRERVRTLPAGIVIIRTLLQAVGLSAAHIGYGGIREGLILDHLRHAAPA